MLLHCQATGWWRWRGQTTISRVSTCHGAAKQQTATSELCDRSHRQCSIEMDPMCTSTTNMSQGTPSWNTLAAALGSLRLRRHTRPVTCKPSGTALRHGHPSHPLVWCARTAAHITGSPRRCRIMLPQKERQQIHLPLRLLASLLLPFAAGAAAAPSPPSPCARAGSNDHLQQLLSAVVDFLQREEFDLPSPREDSSMASPS